MRERERWRVSEIKKGEGEREKGEEKKREGEKETEGQRANEGVRDIEKKRREKRGCYIETEKECGDKR